MNNKLILYTTPEGNIDIDVYFHDETFWLTQKTMANLFGVQVPAISKHLKNIFDEGEIDPTSTISKMEIVQAEGDRKVTREVEAFNLDAIIAVGYRVNSKRATSFRIWATSTLKEFITKGFVLNDTMLKNGKPFGKDYFDELLERIREIRASERRFYQKITDIYSQCSYDYNPSDDTTTKFFKQVQNKLLFAITGNTAPELIASRADSNLPNMGLTTYKNAPTGKILRSDVTISKNYLSKDELDNLNRIVSMYLDYAENQARKNKLTSMTDWANKLDAFLKFNDYELLNDNGKVERAVADELAKKEYNKYRIIQDKNYLSDFDKTVSKLSNTRNE